MRNGNQFLIIYSGALTFVLAILMVAGFAARQKTENFDSKGKPFIQFPDEYGKVTSEFPVPRG